MATWFITGTSSGFGLLLTQKLLSRGDRVAATSRRLEALAPLRAQYGDQLWVRALDVTDGVQVAQVVADAFQELGRVDFVVNNAGVGLFGAVEEASRPQIEHVLAVNLLGSIDVIRAALPRLRSQGRGRIVQVSSAGGQVAYPGYGYYHAAKWGIEAICESLAAEVAGFGITVTIVEPGATPTGFSASKDVAPPLPAYAAGDFGERRRAVTGGAFRGPNDASAIVDQMIRRLDQTNPPLRLPLGEDTYRDLHDAYTRRLGLLEAEEETARSVRRPLGDE